MNLNIYLKTNENDVDLATGALSIYCHFKVEADLKYEKKQNGNNITMNRAI